MISTSTSVSSDWNPSGYTSGVTFTATVTGATSGPDIAGTVTFFDGAVQLGSAAVSGLANVGTGVLSGVMLLGGQHSIAASYSGDANYSASTSPVFMQTVDVVGPTDTLSSAPASASVYGQPVTFTVEFRAPMPAPVPPVGTVTFKDGSTTIGTAPLVPDPSTAWAATATLTISTLSVSSHSITAVFPGDSNYASSTSNALSYTVNKASSNTAVTSSVNPSALCQSVTFTATVTATSPGAGAPTGTVTFTIDGTPGSAITLVGGKASTTTSNLTQTTHSISASYSGDGNFNSSSSSSLTQTVNAAVNWTLSVAVTGAPDPKQAVILPFGPMSVSPQDGSVLLDVPIDANQHSDCGCGCDCNDDDAKAGIEPLALSYSSKTVNAKPIVQATLASDFCANVPSQIAAQLTWAGTPQGTVTFATTGHGAGDVYALPLQVGTAVAASGLYAWLVDVAATVGTFVYSRSASGTLPVVVNPSTPNGHGWSIGGVPYLLIGSAGIAMVDNRSGGARYFTGTPGSLPFTYTSPANDQGTLVKNSNGSFTYTAKDQTKTNFDSTGKGTGQVDPRGLTQAIAYASGLPSTVTQPDGGVGTFSYASSKLASVALPGGRFLTLTYDGNNDLTGIVDPAGALYTLAYNAAHRLTNQKLGPFNATFTYAAANGTLTGIDRGLGTTATVTAAAAQGLGASTAINASQAVAAVTDALSHTTSYTLDALGRVNQLHTADGAIEKWMRNAAGNPTAYTDYLNRTTEYRYDASSQDLTGITYPDGTLATYQYHATFHEVTSIQDALGRLTTMTYDGSTGDRLTVKDALGNVTTMTWSSGLKQTDKDALGRVTTLTWDTTKRRKTAVQDALGQRTTFGYDAAGNQTTVEDALNRVTTRTYDGDRRELTRTNALGGVTTSAYDAAGNMTSFVDELGRSTSYAYDQRGWNTTTTEAVGASEQRTTTNAYDAAGNVRSVTSPGGDVTSFAYDAVNRQTQRIEAHGTALARTTTTAYDGVGNTLSITNPLAAVSSFAYDAMNRPTQRIDAYGTALARTTSTAYDAVGNISNITDPLGVVTSFGYDALDRQTQRVDAFGTPLARTTTTTYDAVSNVKTVTNPVGAVTSIGYDALNRQTQLIEAHGTGSARTTTTTFDAVGNVKTVTNPRGYVTSIGYDALNRRVTQTEAHGDALARTMTTAYDAAGNVLSQTNARAVTTSFAYDALNRPTKQIDAHGTGLARTTTTVYDADDNVTVRIDALGYRTTLGYDALNRQVTVTDPGAGVATTAYDAADNVVNSINQLGAKTTYIYDTLNRRTQTIDARAGIVTQTYDANDNLKSLTDPVGNKTQWLYDALNRKIQETDPLWNSATFAYDAFDRLTSTTDRLGQVVTHAYDLLNRQTSATAYSGSGLLTFTFDANNNLLTAATSTGTITQTYDALDRVATVRDGYATVLTNTYDAADNRTVVQDSFGATTTRAYDVLNRTTTMTFGGASQTPLREDFTYTARDQVQTQTRYSDLAGTTTVGSTTFTYDAVGRPTNLQHKNGAGANIANMTHTYDLASRVTSEVLNGGAPTTYQYDTIDELTHDGATTYSYDLNGNRTMTGYTTGPANQITSDGTWNYYTDKNSNLIQQTKISTGEVIVYGFDNRNRLTTVTDTTSAGLQMQGTYAYDAQGQRIQKQVWTASGGSTTTTRLAYDGRQIWADLDGSSALSMRYVLGERILERLARVSGAGTAAWLLVDRMGSVRNVVDGSGAVIDTIAYNGYGIITSESTPANGGTYKFDGYRADLETGWLRPDPAVDRYYGPVIGRWNKIDLILFKAGQANPWVYGGNNPTNRTDPSGLQISLLQLIPHMRAAQLLDLAKQLENEGYRASTDIWLAILRRAEVLHDKELGTPLGVFFPESARSEIRRILFVAVFEALPKRKRDRDTCIQAQLVCGAAGLTALAAQVDRLIQRLDDDDFSERETARIKLEGLIRICAKIRSQLVAATRSQSFQVADTARRLLRQLDEIDASLAVDFSNAAVLFREFINSVFGYYTLMSGTLPPLWIIPR